MSLFNGLSDSIYLSTKNTRTSLLSQLSGGIQNTLNGGIQNVLGGGIQSALGGGTFGAALGAIAANRVSTAVGGVLNNTVGSGTLGNISKGLGVVNDLQSGNFDEAGLKILDSGLFDSILFGAHGFASQARYLYTKNPLFGGITPLAAKNILAKMQGVNFAKKNLFLINVRSNLSGDASEVFNLFCTDVSYSAQSLAGEKRKIGSAFIDSVHASTATELRMTTLDSKEGFIKQWFKEHAALAAHQDGTVGVPDDYAINIKVVHSAITDNIQTVLNGYTEQGWFRAATIETTLGRRNDGFEEITMTFTQLDTCRGN